MKKLFFCCSIFLACFSASGQIKSTDLTEIKSVVEGIKNLSKVGYQFAIKAHFPNDQVDKTKGEAYLDGPDKVMYNSCEAQTLIYSRDLYYKADHRQKAISIIRMDKRYKKDRVGAIETDFFANAYMDKYIDSTLLKYAIVKQLKENGDTIKMSLTFPASMALKKINITYDRKTSLPVSYYMSIYYPWQGKDKKFIGKGTTYEILCYQYTKKFDKEKYELDKYFTITNGKASLKKYSNYHLTTQL